MARAGVQPCANLFRMKRSAGILMYRRSGIGVQVLLVHPGGPLWARKDDGAWSIPKGEFDQEDALVAARREFEEETGTHVDGEFLPLAPCRQKGGKIIHAFAFEGDLDVSDVRSNTFEMEWPPRSGRMQSYPEVDRAQWFDPVQAMEKINAGQRPLLIELVQKLA